MDPISAQSVLATAGAASGDATYVDDVFSTYVYDGTGSAHSIDNGIDVSGEGGMVWIKRRTPSSGDHLFYDTERNTSTFNPLISNSSDGERSALDYLFSGFNSDGFSIGNTANSKINASDSTYATWTFRKTPGFFDVVTYTGNGANRSIAHSLGSVPGCIIIKCTSRDGDDWIVYHRSLGNNVFINLNQGYGASTDAAAWNSSTPTSTVFYLGTKGQVNTSGQSYVAYIFAHDDQSFGTNSDEAIIKCGSYTGNDSTNGPEIDLGFEPQFVITKSSTAAYYWFMADNIRGMPTSGTTHYFNPNANSDEVATANEIDLTPTGFKLKSGNAQTNNPATYIYIAIRRPNKPPSAGTEVFALDATSASGTTANAFDAPFPVDMVLMQRWGAGEGKYIGSRLMSEKNLYANNTASQINSSFALYDRMDGAWRAFNSTEYSAQMFKRAPGYFDVVAYEGTGSARTLNHNLGVVPELVIVKNRENASYSWAVYTQTLGRNKVLALNNDEAASTFNAPSFWGSTDFTATQISLGSYANTNHNGIDMIAYLFASLDGISKVGTYSGTGYNIDVDCGFTAGARFVLIKRTDGSNGQSVGDWYMWDTAHGIVSGNEPYIRLNDANAQVTGTDYIDPLNAGFTVTSSAPAALNTSGGTYLFLAIA